MVVSEETIFIVDNPKKNLYLCFHRRQEIPRQKTFSPLPDTSIIMMEVMMMEMMLMPHSIMIMTMLVMMMLMPQSIIMVAVMMMMVLVVVMVLMVGMNIS